MLMIIMNAYMLLMMMMSVTINILINDDTATATALANQQTEQATYLVHYITLHNNPNLCTTPA